MNNRVKTDPRFTSHQATAMEGALRGRLVEGVVYVTFELWRQDDNGNRFLISVFTDRAAALRQLAELTSNPHKQIYWIAERHS